MFSIACALGLATCLNFSGHSFTRQEAFRIYDDCGELVHLPTYSFIQHQPKSLRSADIRQAMATSWGASYGRDIEEQGLSLKWPKSGVARKRLWLATCARFERAFNDPSRWSK